MVAKAVQNLSVLPTSTSTAVVSWYGGGSPNSTYTYSLYSGNQLITSSDLTNDFTLTDLADKRGTQYSAEYTLTVTAIKNITSGTTMATSESVNFSMPSTSDQLVYLIPIRVFSHDVGAITYKLNLYDSNNKLKSTKTVNKSADDTVYSDYFYVTSDGTYTLKLEEISDSSISYTQYCSIECSEYGTKINPGGNKEICAYAKFELMPVGVTIWDDTAYYPLKLSDWEYTTDEDGKTIHLNKYIGTEKNVRITNTVGSLISGGMKNVCIGKDSMSYSEYVDLGAIENLLIVNNVKFPTTHSTPLFGNYSNHNKTLKTVWTLSIQCPENMSGMFQYCESLKSVQFYGGSADNLTNISYLFSDCKKLEELDLGCLTYARNVTNMRGMFNMEGYGTVQPQFKELNFPSFFDTSNVTDMSSMFRYCSNLETINVSNFDTSKVTDMSQMFTGCATLKDIDVSDFKTSNVTNMSYMFYDCRGLNSLNVKSFITSKVKNMQSMFGGYSGKSLDLSNFDTSNVTDFSYMFSNCANLESLIVTSFNTSNGTHFGGMFNFCDSLKNIDLSSFDTKKSDKSFSGDTTGMKYMLSNMNSLESITLGESFSFKGTFTDSSMYAVLPDVSSLNKYKESPSLYTGKWVRTDGKYAYTSKELSENYDGDTMHGTYVLDVSPARRCIKGWYNDEEVAKRIKAVYFNDRGTAVKVKAVYVNQDGTAVKVK